MYARCPSCHTIFEINDDILNARVGMARCGICRVAFNASWNLVDQLPGVDPPPTVAHPLAAEPNEKRTDTSTTHEASLDAKPEPVTSALVTEPVEPESVGTPPPVAAAPMEIVGEATELESESIDVSLNEQPEPGMSEQSTKPAAPDFVATPPSVAMDTLEMVNGEIELESESILKEVERLDEELLRKQGNNQRIDDDHTTDVDLATEHYDNDIIPDEEIVLETPADAWQRVGPDARAQPSARDNERVSTTVDRMREMLDPVTGPEKDAEEQDTAAPAEEPPGVTKRLLRRTELPPELDPLRDGGVETALGAAERSNLSAIYSRPKFDPAAMETGTSATAWRGVVWFVGIVTLLMVSLWQVREFYLNDLAQVPAIRPILSEFCQIAACEVPPRRRSRLIDLVGTNVETHPAVPGALRVVVSLINRAEYSQLPPSLEVTLSDRAGRVVGRRTYTPKDYATSSGDAILEPNIVSNVTIDLATPSESAFGYEINLIPD